MKIIVAVKRVIDYNVQVRVKEDGTGVVTENVKMSTNPPDDNAVEEAVKIKETGKAKEIVAVTVGEEKAQETVVASCILPRISIFNFCPVVASSGLTIPKAIDLFNLKPKSPPVALPTTFPFS